MEYLEIKGIMLDPARVMERRETYSEFLKLFAQWGYNTLFWRFCDDEGCRLVFPSHPELATEHAWSAEETRAFVQEANELGIQVIPELECFGHTGYITRHAQYQHLRDGLTGKEFAALAPMHPDSLALLEDLLNDLCDIFPAPWVHIGMDESAFGDHPHTAELLKTKTKPEIFAEHIQWVYGVLKKQGKGTMLWGDHLRPVAESNRSDHLDEEAVSDLIADSNPKDIIICDWYYPPEIPADRMDCFLDRGFRVLACPASSSYGMFGHPADWNLDNLREFIALAKKNVDRGVIGAVNTVWCSGRYLNGTIHYANALAGHLMNADTESPRFANEFIADFFGVADGSEIVEALQMLHRISPNAFALYRGFPVPQDKPVELSEEDHAFFQTLEKTCQQAAEQLQRNRENVQSHIGDYDDILITAQVLSFMGATSKDWNTAESLCARASQAWDRTRHSDDPEKLGTPESGCGYFLQRLIQGTGKRES
jgi:hypothetical protein